MVLEKLDKRGGRLYYVKVLGSLKFLSVNEEAEQRKASC